MSGFHAACVQLTTGVDPASNLSRIKPLITDAAQNGASLIATPEMTGALDIRSGGTRRFATLESEDIVLAALRQQAAELNIWLLIGSLAIRMEDTDQFANRSYLIDPNGEIVTHYDKIHMFDVEVGDGQSYHESKSYRAGTQLGLASTPHGTFGLSICYDVRFPHLYRRLAQSGAQILTCPAAFTKVTGQAHWHVLLRARAIETGCYVIAPAQAGKHEDGRETFGHSLIISPWGEVLAEGKAEGEDIVMAEIDLSQVEKARGRIPSLTNDQNFE
ncbi:MAG: amidohydrolase [Ponticaulis sp.]|nr:amidohydrolase [Ponticaulis sp.]